MSAKRKYNPIKVPRGALVGRSAAEAAELRRLVQTQHEELDLLGDEDKTVYAAFAVVSREGHFSPSADELHSAYSRCGPRARQFVSRLVQGDDLNTVVSQTGIKDRRKAVAVAETIARRLSKKKESTQVP